MYYVLDTGLMNMKRSQLLCWNGFNRRKPPDTSQRRQFWASFVLRTVSNTLGCWVFARGSVLVLMSESLFSIKKQTKKKRKRNNNKWVCMWVLHAIVLICTGVPKKPTWRDHPFLKRQAALQLWPGTTSLIQRDCTTLLQAHVRGVALWPVLGEERRGRDAQLPPHSL